MALRLLLDEDIKSKRLVRLLTEAGHDVRTTADLNLDGQTDQTVLATAASTGRIVLTHNCDDFRAIIESGVDHAGILLVCQEPGKSMSREEIVRAIANLEGSDAPLPGTVHALNAWKF